MQMHLNHSAPEFMPLRLPIIPRGACSGRCASGNFIGCMMYFFGTSIEHSSTPAALQKIGTCRGANFASLFFHTNNQTRAAARRRSCSWWVMIGPTILRRLIECSSALIVALFGTVICPRVGGAMSMKRISHPEELWLGEWGRRVLESCLGT